MQGLRTERCLLHWVAIVSPRSGDNAHAAPHLIAPKRTAPRADRDAPRLKSRRVPLACWTVFPGAYLIPRSGSWGSNVLLPARRLV